MANGPANPLDALLASAAGAAADDATRAWLRKMLAAGKACIGHTKLGQSKKLVAVVVKKRK